MEKCVLMNLSKKFNKKSNSSSFFGNCYVPKMLLDIASEDEIYICQINLNEVNSYVPNSKLPSNGMLYFFIDSQEHAIVRYFKDTNLNAQNMIDFNFNESFKEYNLKEKLGIDFIEGDLDEEGMKLLGTPASFLDLEEDTVLLLQYDPTKGSFKNDFDGYIYFLIKKDDLKNENFNRVKLYFDEY